MKKKRKLALTAAAIFAAAVCLKLHAAIDYCIGTLSCAHVQVPATTKSCKTGVTISCSGISSNNCAGTTMWTVAQFPNDCVANGTNSCTCPKTNSVEPLVITNIAETCWSAATGCSSVNTLCATPYKCEWILAPNGVWTCTQDTGSAGAPDYEPYLYNTSCTQ